MFNQMIQSTRTVYCTFPVVHKRNDHLICVIRLTSPCSIIRNMEETADDLSWLKHLFSIFNSIFWFFRNSARNGECKIKPTAIAKYSTSIKQKTNVQYFDKNISNVIEVSCVQVHFGTLSLLLSYWVSKVKPNRTMEHRLSDYNWKLSKNKKNW